MNFNLSSDRSFDTLQTKENLIFVDPTVENYHSLISDTSINSEIVMLDPLRDGVLQITEELAQHSNINSLHFISHGKSGSIQLGNTELNLDTLDDYADELQSWNNALTSDADIILYGCNIGANQAGEDLIDRLANVTNADIAASNDLTGSAALGGDWEWEITTGDIETSLAFPTEVAFKLPWSIGFRQRHYDDEDGWHAYATPESITKFSASLPSNSYCC